MVRKIRYLVSLIVTLSALFTMASSISAYNIVVNDYIVSIVSTGDNLKVTEDIELDNKNTGDVELLNFWIQKEAQEPITILLVDRNLKLAPVITGNNYVCNLSIYNISIKKGESCHIRVTYNLPVTTTEYDKRLTYDTTVISVSLDGRVIGRIERLSSDVLLSLPLYKSMELPVHPLYLIFIIILAVVIILVMLILLKKQRSRMRKREVSESDELLSTKKALLLSVLKEIEKQYRAGAISDDTYNKIKDEYKQQAVDVMRKLEDRKKT